MKNLENMQIWENHMHTITKNNICKKFIGSAFIQRFVTENTFPIILLLDAINPLTDKDSLSRYADFLGRQDKSQLQNLLDHKQPFPDNTIYTILSINMGYMGAGPTKVSFENQLIELIRIKLKESNVKVFYHLDPNAPDCTSLLQKYSKYIDGIKLYSLMGHFLDHSNIKVGLRWCAENKKPVTLHTSPESPVYYKGPRKRLVKLLESNTHPLYPSKKRRPSKKELCKNFLNPLYYEDMLKENPDVNFNFAHLAGENEVRKMMNGEYSMSSYILDLCRQYKNAFFDIAYTFYSEELQRLLLGLLQEKNILRKCLFGTDFYMNRTKTGSQQAFYLDLIEVIGIHNFIRIAVINPKIFNNGNI